jgi:hypothetical protein
VRKGKKYVQRVRQGLVNETEGEKGSKIEKERERDKK